MYVHYMKWRKINKFPFAYCQFIAICFFFSDIDEFNTDFKIRQLTVCSGGINLIFTKIITQTQTNAWTTLTTVAKMPPVPTPKGPSTVVANQGTLEMATTVQVGSWNSCLVFR